MNVGLGDMEEDRRYSGGSGDENSGKTIAVYQLRPGEACLLKRRSNHVSDSIVGGS